MIYRTLDLVKSTFDLEEQDIGNLGNQKVRGLNFKIKSYDVKGVGHLSTMDVSGMMGLMKMQSVIITPFCKDAPLFSYDRVFAMGNDTFILELYDTMLDKENESYKNSIAKFVKHQDKVLDIPNHELESHWYDYLRLEGSTAKKTKNQKTRLNDYYLEALNHYFDMIKSAPDTDVKQKKEKSGEYVSGLYTNGGASTDAFIKKLGKQKVVELYEKALFGNA